MEHRRAATYDIVFHSGDIQDKISDAKAAADAFVERIGKMLGPPIPHAYHRYWAGTVDYYLDIREDQGLRVAPPELDTSRCRPRTFLRLALRRLTPLSLLFTCHRWLMGRAPRVTPLHHSWLDYVHLREATARLLDAPEPRLLFVCANVESAKRNRESGRANKVRLDMAGFAGSNTQAELNVAEIFGRSDLAAPSRL